MGTAKRVETGTREAGLAIEYVRRRRMVRLLGWLHNETIEPVEIPLNELRQRLGIDPRDLGAPQQYLLFAGSHRRPAGGFRDLVGTFDSEQKAWAAFRELRQAHPSVQSWAELAAIDTLGKVNLLAWFGLHQEADADEDEPQAAVVDPPAHRKEALSRTLGAAHASAYPRSITPS